MDYCRYSAAPVGPASFSMSTAKARICGPPPDALVRRLAGDQPSAGLRRGLPATWTGSMSPSDALTAAGLEVGGWEGVRPAPPFAGVIAGLSAARTQVLLAEAAPLSGAVRDTRLALGNRRHPRPGRQAWRAA